MSTGRSERAGRWLDRIEDALLTVLLMTLVILGATQIILRNGFDSGLLWIDPLLRVIVLWLGLIGAVAAARRNKNIRIDLLTRYVPARIGRGVDLLTHLFASGVCGLIGWHGVRMVRLEAQYADTGVLGLPIWVLQLVIPVAFTLMALIYLVTGLARLKKGAEPLT